MRELYSMLNDVNTDIDLYKKEELTDIENEKMKKAVRNMSTKKRKGKAIARVACAACAVIVVGSLVFQNDIKVAAKSIAWQIGNYMGTNKDLQNYTTVLHTSKTDNGYTITLNEVIMDKEELIISTTVKGEQKLGDFLQPCGEVYVNGKLASDAAGGGSKFVDDYTEESITAYELKNIDTNIKLDIELNFEQLGVGENTAKGNWKFNFKADGTALAADTIHIPIHSGFSLPNGSKVNLLDLALNNLGQKIYFNISEVSGSKCADYDMKLEGKDNLGNKIEFSIRCIKGDSGTGRFECDFDGISSDAKSITLTPYAVKMPETSGKLSDDFKPVGENIMINLK